MTNFSTDIKAGQVVQTADGMMHRVEDVQLVVWIKAIAPTDAPILGVDPDTVRPIEGAEQ